MAKIRDIEELLSETDCSFTTTSDASLDRIAGMLRGELEREIETRAVHLADAARLAQVARALSNSSLLAELETWRSACTRRRDELIEARLILEARACPE